MQVCYYPRKSNSKCNGLYTMQVEIISKSSSRSTTLKQSIFTFFQYVINATDENINITEDKSASKGDLGVMKRIYLFLGLVGVLVEIVSLFSIFVTPIIDHNITYVLVPMGVVYLLMIIIDYMVRGRTND